MTITYEPMNGAGLAKVHTGSAAIQSSYGIAMQVYQVVDLCAYEKGGLRTYSDRFLLTVTTVYSSVTLFSTSLEDSSDVGMVCTCEDSNSNRRR